MGTELEIREPDEEIARELGASDFAANLTEEIGRRYGRFLGRGLAIVVNGMHAVAHEITLRENGPFPIENKFYRTESGVAIYLKVGEHCLHRFKGEPGYDIELNKRLTGEYGWTVFCNDRAILIADTTRTTGWDTKFHSEFYGLFASVSFVSSDPSKLPWNTTKTDVDLNNPAYKRALEDMRRFAEGWRQFTDKYKKARKEERERSIPPAMAPAGTPPPAPQKAGDRGFSPLPAIKPVATKVGHNDLRFVLPANINEHWCNDKFLEIVREAKTLDIGTHSYAALAVLGPHALRVLSNSLHDPRMKKGAGLKAFAMKIREDKSGKLFYKPHSFSPRLEEVLAFPRRAS